MVIRVGAAGDARILHVVEPGGVVRMSATDHELGALFMRHKHRFHGLRARGGVRVTQPVQVRFAIVLRPTFIGLNRSARGVVASHIWVHDLALTRFFLAIGRHRARVVDHRLWIGPLSVVLLQASDREALAVHGPDIVDLAQFATAHDCHSERLLLLIGAFEDLLGMFLEQASLDFKFLLPHRQLHHLAASLRVLVSVRLEDLLVLLLAHGLLLLLVFELQERALFELRA